ncbi:MAG: hypothetical protein J5I93_18470 [Pirellulaceae bacterium]|nr:hypothetical protein [Pirellulaceae bacterium]
MARRRFTSGEEEFDDATPARRRFWTAFTRHPGLVALFLFILVASLLISFWNVLFQNVPSGHMLVVISKSGRPLEDGQVLAQPGQKGIQERVLGEGWHFIVPLLYATEIKPNIMVPGAKLTSAGLVPPKVGIVKALGGTPLPPGQFLAERGQQGIWREILLPGSYRLNPYGYEVKFVDMVEIKQGYVGVKRRKLGEDGPSEYATKPTEKGILKDVILQPGLYPINTEEFEVLACEVGIYQTSYHYSTDPAENTALVFDASDSNRIQLDCTIEWELVPEHWPEWLSKFRSMERIEATVIKPNVKNISRNKGQNYGAEDFLEGAMRERFQADFNRELLDACMDDNVIIRNSFIRNIIIPDTFLRPKREEQIAKEKAATHIEQTQTAETQNEVDAAERTIRLEVAKVTATTERIVAGIEREAENVMVVANAEVEKIKDEYSAKIAILEAERSQTLGNAEAEAKKLVSTAKNGLYKMQLAVFAQDGESFIRYTMAENLNPEMRLRLFQSGPGTLWTNMGNKDMNLFMPLPNSGSAPASRP